MPVAPILVLVRGNHKRPEVAARSPGLLDTGGLGTSNQCLGPRSTVRTPRTRPGLRRPWFHAKPIGRLQFGQPKRSSRLFVQPKGCLRLRSGWSRSDRFSTCLFFVASAPICGSSKQRYRHHAGWEGRSAIAAHAGSTVSQRGGSLIWGLSAVVTGSAQGGVFADFLTADAWRNPPLHQRVGRAG